MKRSPSCPMKLSTAIYVLAFPLTLAYSPRVQEWPCFWYLVKMSTWLAPMNMKIWWNVSLDFTYSFQQEYVHLESTCSSYTILNDHFEPFGGWFGSGHVSLLVVILFDDSIETSSNFVVFFYYLICITIRPSRIEVTSEVLFAYVDGCDLWTEQGDRRIVEFKGWMLDNL